jgi:ribonucleoside-diphosphate reductase beta chain
VTEATSGGLVGEERIKPERLFPLRYPWAYALVQQAKRNTWFPEEAPLHDDVRDWREKLGEDEKAVVETLLGFFNPMEALVTTNIAMALYPYFTAPEVRLYLARQAWEEANHAMAFEYVINTLPVDRERVLHLHEEHPAIAAKERFQRELIERIVAEELDLSTAEGKRALLQNLVGQFVVLEGIFFYSGFALALAFRQRGLMRGLCTIIDWVLRDESLHLAFGTLLIHEYLREQKEAATEEAMSSARELIIKAVALEEAYNLAVLPRPLLGLSAASLNQFVRYVTDRRLRELGLKPEYNVSNPLKWLALQVDVPELVNFFEAKHVGYQVGYPRG